MPKTDYSKISGNPTHALQQQYEALMGIEDLDELKDAAVSIVKPLVGSGMSSGNYKKFMLNLQRSSARGLDSVRHFLTNYILAGSGMAVGESLIDAMDAILMENSTKFSTAQWRLKNLVESCTDFVVVLA